MVTARPVQNVSDMSSRLVVVVVGFFLCVFLCVCGFFLCFCGWVFFFFFFFFFFGGGGGS